MSHPGRVRRTSADPVVSWWRLGIGTTMLVAAVVVAFIGDYGGGLGFVVCLPAAAVVWSARVGAAQAEVGEMFSGPLGLLVTAACAGVGVAAVLLTGNESGAVALTTAFLVIFTAWRGFARSPSRQLSSRRRADLRR